MEQVPQAYVDHHDRWLRTFQQIKSKRAHDPNIWEEGVLDLVSPADLQVRQELGKTGIDLPWGGRGDLELYWRIMYAAYAEFLALTDPGIIHGKGIRPVRDVLDACQESYRKEVVQDIFAAAGHQMRLRSGSSKRPEPMVRFTRVLVDHHAALIVGYSFTGKVIVDRETVPTVMKETEWLQNTRDGRWTALVMPWQLQLMSTH